MLAGLVNAVQNDWRQQSQPLPRRDQTGRLEVRTRCNSLVDSMAHRDEAEQRKEKYSKSS